MTKLNDRERNLFRERDSNQSTRHVPSRRGGKIASSVPPLHHHILALHLIYEMDFYSFFSGDIPTSKPESHIPGLEFELKPNFDELIPSLRGWRQNVLLLGQSNAGKSYFMKKLLEVMRPKRLYIISNTSPEQYRQEGTLIKHYSVMPESIEDTNIEPESCVIIIPVDRVSPNRCLKARHEADSFEPAEWSERLPSRRSGWLGAAVAGSIPAFSTFFSLLFLFFQRQHSSSARDY